MLILIIFIIFFSLGWYSIGNENTYIIKFKRLLPLELRNNLKNSIFIVPKLIQENTNLKEKINQLNSSINAGLNFNDEVFLVIIIGMVLENFIYLLTQVIFQ